ncbi:MAG: ACT domain-containing protein [Planctomycetes bacterium]|nr:ACT domain-containing protein [Planctomycetota bacterium]
MQTRKQVTVFLENKPGRLAQVLSALAHGKINIIALSVMDRHEHGVLRVVTEDEAATVKVLQTLNTHFTESDVLAVELKNQPGALANICERLAEEHVNIDYAYCSSGGRNGKVFGIFKVSNLEKAQRIVSEGAKNSRKLEKPTLRDQRTYKK